MPGDLPGAVRDRHTASERLRILNLPKLVFKCSRLEGTFLIQTTESPEVSRTRRKDLRSTLSGPGRQPQRGREAGCPKRPRKSSVCCSVPRRMRKVAGTHIKCLFLSSSFHSKHLFGFSLYLPTSEFLSSLFTWVWLTLALRNSFCRMQTE